jgi:DNA-binding transcriptional MocR family regulator
MLQRTSSQPLFVQLADRLGQRISTRLLAPGAKLPSVRQCAQQHGVSAATVVQAYDLLAARGLVLAEPKKGFFVRLQEEKRQEPSAKRSSIATNIEAIEVDAHTHAHTHAPISAEALIRGMFQSQLVSASGKALPGMGVLPREWLQNDFLPRALREVASPKNVQELALQYGDPQGDAPLRRALAHKLKDIHVSATPEQIITTVGATHALDVASRCLLKPGDAVMVEEPGWAVEFARLQALGMRVLPVPRGLNGVDGPDVATLQRYCELHAPKLYVSVSVLHNPTGATLSPAAAHRVLQLAAAHNFHVLEDDTYSHLAESAATRLAALDGLQRVIYISGFAKVLAPNWRVGFMAAPAALVERLTDTKMLSTLTTPALMERALSLCIERGQLRRHAERVRSQLAQARQRCVKLVEKAGCRFAAEPAGLFGWIDTGVDTDALAQRMLDHGYLLAPGSLFHASKQPSTLMRINFATTQEAAFWQCLKSEIGKSR